MWRVDGGMEGDRVRAKRRGRKRVRSLCTLSNGHVSRCGALLTVCGASVFIGVVDAWACLGRLMSKAERCRSDPPGSSRSSSSNSFGVGAHCHWEAVGAPLTELQRRADAEAAADDATAAAASGSDATAAGGAAGASSGPMARQRGWRGWLEELEWQWRWMGRRPTSIAAAGWSDQLLSLIHI